MRKIEGRLLGKLLKTMAINSPVQHVATKDGQIVCETAEENLRISGGQVTVEQKDGSETARYQIELISRSAIVVVKLYNAPIEQKIVQWNDDDETKIYQMARDVAV